VEPLELRQAITALDGRWTAPSGTAPEAVVTGVSTDSRAVAPGELFVALDGDRFDGHDFVPAALDRGALACVVASDRAASLAAELGEVPLIAVDDPLSALERLAIAQLRRIGAEVTAITGTVGKTTTKEFLGTLLAERYRVHQAPKSYNNCLGVALTILGADASTEQLVLEMGTSGAGELSHLSRIVQPDRVVLTAIAPAHLEGLGSIDGVIDAKSEIFEGLAPEGRAYLCVDLPHFERIAARVPCPVTPFGADGGDLALTDCAPAVGSAADDATIAPGWEFKIDGERMKVGVPGRHNLVNIAAAIVVARDLGLDLDEIRSGLSRCRLPPKRLELSRENGVVFLDDSYNANPRSMRAALDVLDDIATRDDCARTVAVLGDMLELGAESQALHRELGRGIAAKPVDVLVTVGDQSRHLSAAYETEMAQAPAPAAAGSSGLVRHFDAANGALEFLEHCIEPGDRVLFKGSNAAGLGSLATRVRDRWTARSTETVRET